MGGAVVGGAVVGGAVVGGAVVGGAVVGGAVVGGAVVGGAVVGGAVVGGAVVGGAVVGGAVVGGAVVGGGAATVRSTWLGLPSAEHETVTPFAVFVTATLVIHAESVLPPAAEPGTEYDTDATGPPAGTATAVEDPVPVVPSGSRTPNCQSPVNGTPAAP